MPAPLLPLASALILPSLLGCSKPDYGLSTLALELEVSSPEYGVFLGDEAAVVTGRVAPASARLYVEGEEVQMGEGGAFSVALPMDGLDYRVIDVEATLGSQQQRIRVPVFSGENPIDSWPGAATARLTTAGFDRLAQSVGGLVDGLGWQDAILDAIPSLDTDYVDIYASTVAHDPTQVTLVPGDDGIEARVVLANVSLDGEINALDGLIVVPLSIGFSEIAIDALLTIEMDADGLLSLVVGAATIDIGKAEFQFGALDGWLLELVTDLLVGFVEPLGDGLLEWLLADYGTIELGGPLAFETDLLGTSVEAAVSELYTDVEGLGAGLGIGIGAPAPEGSPSIPTPGLDDGAAGAHATLAVHEGLFQLLLSGSLLDLLGEFDLSGTYGDILGNMIAALPGGETAPASGWCIDLDPGQPMVVRMKESVAPVARLYMPDFQLRAGTGATCEPWLEASLEVTLDLGFADGTALDLGVEVPDGAVLYYAAEAGSWEEDEVVAGLGDTLGTLIGLAGSFLDLDLGSLLGELGSGDPADPMSLVTADLAPRVVDSRKLYAADGTWTPGLYVLSLELWAE